MVSSPRPALDEAPVSVHRIHTAEAKRNSEAQCYHKVLDRCQAMWYNEDSGGER